MNILYFFFMVKKETQNSKNPFILWLGILWLILPVLLFLRFYEFYTGTWIPMFVPKPWYIADKIVIYKAWVLSFIWWALVLFFFVRTIKTIWKKSLKNAGITFFIWFITYLSIFIVAPSYTFQTYPRVFLYTDIKGEYIKYPNYYFWLVEKLGFTQFSQSSYKRIFSSDDIINWFEIAKKNNNFLLYTYLFKNAMDNWIDTFIEKYDDIFFQDYLLNSILAVGYWNWEYEHEIKEAEVFFSRIEIFKKLLSKTNDEKMIKALRSTLTEYQKFLDTNGDKVQFFKKIKNIYIGYSDN